MRVYVPILSHLICNLILQWAADCSSAARAQASVQCWYALCYVCLRSNLNLLGCFCEGFYSILLSSYSGSCLLCLVSPLFSGKRSMFFSRLSPVFRCVFSVRGSFRFFFHFAFAARCLDSVQYMCSPSQLSPSLVSGS